MSSLKTFSRNNMHIQSTGTTGISLITADNTGTITFSDPVDGNQTVDVGELDSRMKILESIMYPDLADEDFALLILKFADKPEILKVLMQLRNNI